MTNFQSARKNMIDCQIRPSSVVMPAVLEAFESVPRERFVPKKLQSVAYMDEDLMIDGGFLLEPTTHARMLEALDPGADDVVLDIGCATGYSSAVLSSMVSTVIALEPNQNCLKQAEKVWEELKIGNIAGFKGALKNGNPDHAPFDLIFMNGSVCSIPEALTDQLKPGGRLIAIVKAPSEKTGEVTLIKSLGDKGVSSQVLFEASCPYLSGFEPESSFSF